MKDRIGECVDSSSRSRARNEIGKRFHQIAKKVLETRGPLATTLIAYVVSAQLQSFKNQNQPRALRRLQIAFLGRLVSTNANPLYSQS